MVCVPAARDELVKVAVIMPPTLVTTTGAPRLTPPAWNWTVPYSAIPESTAVWGNCPRNATQRHATPPQRPSRLDRTIAELRAAALAIERDLKRKHAEEAARKRAKRLADMAADPMRALRETERLVKQRSTDAYHEIAMRLADLREALSGSEQSGLADQQARKLKDKNPTLNLLTAELRGQGFLKK